MKVGPGTGRAVTFLKIDQMVFPADITSIRELDFPSDGDGTWVFVMEDESKIFASGSVCCMIHKVEE